MLLEVIGLLLEDFEGVNSALFESILACSYQTFCTMPVVIREGGLGWIQAVGVETEVAAFTDDNVLLVFCLVTLFALLSISTVARLAPYSGRRRSYSA